jgi:hypothetical protein
MAPDLRAANQVLTIAEKGVGAQLTVIQKERAQVRDERLLLCQTRPNFMARERDETEAGGREVVEAVGEIRTGTHPVRTWISGRDPTGQHVDISRVRSERDGVFIDEPLVRPCAPTHGGYSGSRMA